MYLHTLSDTRAVNGYIGICNDDKLLRVSNDCLSQGLCKLVGCRVRKVGVDEFDLLYYSADDICGNIFYCLFYHSSSNGLKF